MAELKLIFDQILHLFEMHVLFRIKDIGPKDMVDILILSFIFFLVFKFIINRRAGSLALGLLFLLIVMALTWLFDMKAMQFILQNFAQAGIIAIIIMFQPELRSGLEKIGTMPISNIKHVSPNTKNASHIMSVITTITEAACELSMEKTGALIVNKISPALQPHGQGDRIPGSAPG